MLKMNENTLGANSFSTADPIWRCCVVHTEGHLTQEPEVPGSIPNRAHNFVSASSDSRRAAASNWQESVHSVLVNCFQGLSMPRKSRVTNTLIMSYLI